MPLSQDSVDAATCLLAHHDNLNKVTVDQVCRRCVDGLSERPEGARM